MTGGFLVAAVTAFVVAQLKAIAYANRLSPSLAAAFCVASATFICLTAPWSVALAPSVRWVTAAGFGVLALKRTSQRLKILRYHRNIRRLSRYALTSDQIPVSRRWWTGGDTGIPGGLHVPE